MRWGHSERRACGFQMSVNRVKNDLHHVRRLQVPPTIRNGFAKAPGMVSYYVHNRICLCCVPMYSNLRGA